MQKSLKKQNAKNKQTREFRSPVHAGMVAIHDAGDAKNARDANDAGNANDAKCERY